MVLADDKSRSRDSEFRRRRVQRIKKIIVTTVIILLVLPTILTIFLMVKVFHLQGQVNDIMTERAQERIGEDVDSSVSAQTALNSATAAAVTGSASTTTAARTAGAEKGKVYLTFDDGPGTQTEKILDILKKEKVKATFFVTGKEDSYSKKMYKRIVKEGHTLGMHSYSHVYSDIYSSVRAFTKDLDRISRLLYETTGVKPAYYRFPGGSSTSSTEIPIADFIKVLDDRGIVYLDWNVISPDAVNASVQKNKMITGILDAVSAYDTSVVLLYDVADRPMTVKALPGIIRELKKEKYKLLPVDKNTARIRHSN